MIKKCILLTVLLLMLLPLFCGCVENNTKDDGIVHMNIDYKNREDGTSYTVYNGEEQQFFGVKEGGENVVGITVTTESGSLRITIHKQDDPESIVYDGHEFPSEYFTVTAKEPGRYRILVHAEDFVGAYKFTYDLGQ